MERGHHGAQRPYRHARELQAALEGEGETRALPQGDERSGVSCGGGLLRQPRPLPRGRGIRDREELSGPVLGTGGEWSVPGAPSERGLAERGANAHPRARRCGLPVLRRGPPVPEEYTQSGGLAEEVHRRALAAADRTPAAQATRGGSGTGRTGRTGEERER